MNPLALRSWSGHSLGNVPPWPELVATAAKRGGAEIADGRPGRLWSLHLADRVLLMEDGRLIADGSHAELLRTEPRYAEVLAQAEEHERQVRATLEDGEGPRAGADAPRPDVLEPIDVAVGGGGG